MADKVITFTVQDQQKIEEIIIDKDESAALQYLSDLVDKIKGHSGHACGTKVV